MASTSQPTPKQVSDYILNRGSIGNERKSIASQVSARIIANNPGYADQFRQRDEEERKRKEQEAIAQFQAKEQEAKNQQQYQNDFLASVGATTPDGQGGQTSFNPSGFKELASSAFDTTMNYSRGVADYAKDNGMGGVMAQTGIGAAKKVGEIASGIAKTGYGLSSASGYSTLRKIVSKVGGQEVAQYIDRNTPEYLKAVDAHIDDDGILNYKAKYDNDIQKVGGAAAEIGSYFIPVTRLGKVAKLEKALADIPKVAKALEATPKVVKVGGKLMYEVSKDIVDASLLDAVQGKSWEDIQETAKMAGIGGGALRVGGKLLGSALKSFKENRILDTVTKAIPEITKEEKVLANELLSQGKPLDDVVTDILAKREDNGVDIFKGIDDAVDEVPVKTPENTPETPSKMPQDVPSEVKAPDVPTVAAKAEDPLLQEARKYKSAEEFVKAQGETLYHGSPDGIINKIDSTKLKPNGELGSGFYLSENPKMAGNYTKGNGDVNEINIGGLKILNTSKGGLDGFVDNAIKYGSKEKYIQSLKDAGYDGIRAMDKGETVIFPESVSKLKTKSQLTDLYNQANKVDRAAAKAEDPLLQEAGKPSEKIMQMAKESPNRSSDFINDMSGQRFFHGSANDFNQFDMSKVGKTHYSDWGNGVSLAKYEDVAQAYKRSAIEGTNSKGFVKDFYIDPGAKIYKYHKTSPRDISPKLGDKLKKEGYDALYIYDETGKVEEALVMNPKVIYNESQLTDLYNQANKAPEVAPKVAPEVPKEGAVKANSDFAKRLNQILPEGDKIDETYDTVNMRKEIAAAEKNAAEDPEKLDRLAMGTEKSSTETQTAANIVAVEKAVEKGDYEKAATLLNARFKANNRRGQEISMEQVSAAMNPHERPMKDVMKQRLERLTNKEKDPVKAQEIVDKKVEATKQEIRKAVKPKIKIERAQKLLDDLICPV